MFALVNFSLKPTIQMSQEVVIAKNQTVAIYHNMFIAQYWWCNLYLWSVGLKTSLKTLEASISRGTKEKVSVS
jgi:hypothetical protein